MKCLTGLRRSRIGDKLAKVAHASAFVIHVKSPNDKILYISWCQSVYIENFQAFSHSKSPKLNLEIFLGGYNHDFSNWRHLLAAMKISSVDIVDFVSKIFSPSFRVASSRCCFFSCVCVWCCCCCRLIDLQFGVPTHWIPALVELPVSTSHRNIDHHCRLAVNATSK